MPNAAGFLALERRRLQIALTKDREEPGNHASDADSEPALRMARTFRHWAGAPIMTGDSDILCGHGRGQWTLLCRIGTDAHVVPGGCI